MDAVRQIFGKCKSRLRAKTSVDAWPTKREEYGCQDASYSMVNFNTKSVICTQVYSARQLPQPAKGVVSPFITIEVRNPTREVPEQKTKVVRAQFDVYLVLHYAENNGFNPSWGESFEFEVERAELSYLILRIGSEDRVGSTK